jgi:phosphopantothenoylcysteine decarboxylase/phosphopantothenate--cysteine ligase
MTPTERNEQAPQGRVLLAVTGSIAAFKAAELASLTVQSGREVRVILTEAGSKFVTPLTFEAITSHPTASDVWQEQTGGSRMGHLELATWTDLLVVAPASAGAIARLALGLASDLLGAVALATRARLLLAPAMESNMWHHPATRGHLELLRARGAHVVGPESGRLASGATGEGRMAEPESILDVIEQLLRGGRSLREKRVLVTAGPTYEAIDPVRFIGNRSSGKMGYAVAEEARDRGAQVVLVSGPTALPDPFGITVLRVESASEMREEVLRHVDSCDIVVSAAAVADFAPKNRASDKLSRSDGLSLELSPTEDISAAASEKAPNALHIGFALETSDLVAGARAKLRRKKQNLVIANAVGRDHNPFGAETNEVTLVTAEEATPLPAASKREVARAIWDKVEQLLESR